MDNERDADGHMLCPICGQMLRNPLGCPIMGTTRVHGTCSSSPYRARGTDPASSAGDRGEAVWERRPAPLIGRANHAVADIEGAITIANIGKKTWVWLARHTGGRVPHREFDDQEALDAFLQKIGVATAKRQQALAELQKRPAVTAGLVRLSPERLKALGLIV